jgi:hypothetical protein
LIGEIRVNNVGLFYRNFGGLTLSARCCRLLARCNLSSAGRRQFLFCFLPKLVRLLALGSAPPTRCSNQDKEQPDDEKDAGNDGNPYPQGHSDYPFVRRGSRP